MLVEPGGGIRPLSVSGSTNFLRAGSEIAATEACREHHAAGVDQP